MGAVQHMTPDYNEAVTHARMLGDAIIAEDGILVDTFSLGNEAWLDPWIGAGSLGGIALVNHEAI